MLWSGPTPGPALGSAAADCGCRDVLMDSDSVWRNREREWSDSSAQRERPQGNGSAAWTVTRTKCNARSPTRCESRSVGNPKQVQFLPDPLILEFGEAK